MNYDPSHKKNKIMKFVESLAAEDPTRFEPELDAKESEYIRFAHSAMQGVRDEMEDRYTVHIDVIKEFFPQEDRKYHDKYYIAFFGLFDGHGGNRCADYCSRQLLLASLNVLAPKKTLSQLLKNLSNDQLLKKCFVKADEAFRNTDRVQEREAQGKKVSGSTAVVAWIVVNKEDSKYDVIVASAGDSRCVLYDKGKTIALTRDHKPTDEEEIERIYDAGGFVSRKRVNACLAMSRALGDFRFKMAPGLPPDLQAVTPVPDVNRAEISPDMEHGDSRRNSMDESEDSTCSSSGSTSSSTSSSTCSSTYSSDSEGHDTDNIAGKGEDEEMSDASEKKKKKRSHRRHRHDYGGENDLSFLVMACDGVWDVMSNEEATAYVARRMAKKTRRGSIGGGKDTSGRYPLDRICKRLCDHCVLDLGSTDNVSVSVIQFKRDRKSVV